MPELDDLREEYETLFDSCEIHKDKLNLVDAVVKKITDNRDRYEAVSDATEVEFDDGSTNKIPWWVIGVIHQMECSGSFNKHLHNGDPLTDRTVQVPKGRPKEGNPPFSWEESAIDAIQYDKLDEWEDWDVGGILFKIESYNGWGYRRKNINSPYLWSFSNQYEKGKYVADGKYDPEAVSKQCGAAVLIKRMIEQDIILPIAGD